MYNLPAEHAAVTEACGPVVPAPRPPAASWALRIVAAIAIVFLLHFARPLLLPIVVAVAFTFVLSEPVRRLRRLGIPEAAGAGVVVGAVIGVLVLVVSMLAAPAGEWLDRAPTTV